MNTLTTNPDAARTIARHLIAERVQNAEQARTARAVRQERRAARASHEPAGQPLPWWAFRFLRPAH